MNKKLKIKLDMLLRVGRFCDEYRSEFTPGSILDTLSSELRTESARIDEIIVQRGVGCATARSTVVQKGLARKHLVARLREIRNAAAAMEGLHPGLATRFAFESTFSDVELLSTARQIKSDASPYENEFVRCGVADNFLDLFGAEIEVFANLLREKQDGLGEQIRGNSGLAARTRAASALVQRLDRVMRIHLADRPGELAEWEQTKRMRQLRREETAPVAAATAA